MKRSFSLWIIMDGGASGKVTKSLLSTRVSVDTRSEAKSLESSQETMSDDNGGNVGFMDSS